ncbi:hypothetical protein HND97_03620 [Vibrio cholerae]|nr:hypothetical protein HND97_03620 [Vibrio cholerae]
MKGNITRLDQWRHEGKWSLLYQEAPAPKLHMHKKLQSQRTSHKHKIKKAIASLLKDRNDKAAEFLNDILNTEGRCS